MALGEIFLVTETDSELYSFTESLLQVYNFIKKETEIETGQVVLPNAMDVNLSKFQEMVKDGEAWCVVVHGITKSWTQLSN